MTSAGIDLLNCTLNHKGRLQATRDVIQNGIVPPGQPSLVQCVFKMNQNMEQSLLHHVPTELAIDQSALPPLLKVSEGTTRKVPHVGLPCDAFILSLQ
jgi:hypothetical protein